jgi:hypothetical protein
VQGGRRQARTIIIISNRNRKLREQCSGIPHAQLAPVNAASDRKTALLALLLLHHRICKPAAAGIKAARAF